MIKNKEDLHRYLEADKYALGMSSRKIPRPWADEIWRFEIYLRKYEFYLNKGHNKILFYYYKFRHHYLGIKLGLTVPPNVFGEGLRIEHYGYLVVSPLAKIGAWCCIHQGVNIGVNCDGKAPNLGHDCYIGPGAKLFGDIHIGNDVMIGANAVVNKSFKLDSVTIAGVPARVIWSGNV